MAFILAPLIFVFAFAVHPGLLHPRLLSEEALILRAHHDALLAFAHVLVVLDVGLLIVVALHFMKLLDDCSAGWSGFIGAVLAIIGSVALAADKGALCLTVSAVDTLPENQFIEAMPALLAIFSKHGWMILVWGVVLISVGFLIQAIGLFAARAIPRWQSILFIIAVLAIGTPDGMEIINLTASILLALAFVPVGVRLIARSDAAAQG